jgi:hypothetical protein
VEVTYHARNGAGKQFDPITATFELAASEDFSFNINTQYHFIFTFSAGINGSGAISFSVESVANWNWGAIEDEEINIKFLEAANTYMTTPSGSPFLIPIYNKDYPAFGQVSRAIYAAPDADSSLPENWLDVANLKVGILWTDVDPTTKTVVEKVQLKGDLDDNTLTILVTPGADKGNALIILYDDSNTNGFYTTGEDIKWSWLIWNVDYTPTGTWMDRNLGATTNAPGASTVYGFLYEWGRPHPFNHAQYNTDALENLYVYSNGAASSTSAVNTDAGSGTITISTWMNNPTTFYYGGDAASGLTTENSNLWSGSSKTVYDPCPSGWRVPDSGSWASGDFGTFADYGRIATSKGGYYPAAGQRFYYSSGNVTNVGTDGYYGYASCSSSVWDYMYFNLSAVYDNESFHRTNGYSIRCIKE